MGDPNPKLISHEKEEYYQRRAKMLCEDFGVPYSSKVEKWVENQYGNNLTVKEPISWGRE